MLDENMEEDNDEKSMTETPHLTDVEKEVSMLKADILARWHFHSLVTMRLCDAQDTEINKFMEDRNIINRITSAIPMLTLANSKAVSFFWIH